jgi:hypothetical protein
MSVRVDFPGKGSDCGCQRSVLGFHGMDLQRVLVRENWGTSETALRSCACFIDINTRRSTGKSREEIHQQDPNLVITFMVNDHDRRFEHTRL